MPDSFIGLPPDSTGKKTRTRQRVIGANTVEEQYVITTSDRVASAKILVSTFRIAGLASTPHNLFTLENPVGSPILVGVRRCTLQMVATAAVATLTNYRSWRTTVVPSGGAVLTKFALDTGDTLNTGVVARGASSADGTAAAITHALPTSTPAWQQSQPTMITSGVEPGEDNTLLPSICEDEPFILRPGQTLLVAATTASAATTSYVINCLWEEYTIP